MPLSAGGSAGRTTSILQKMKLVPNLKFGPGEGTIRDMRQMTAKQLFLLPVITCAQQA
jgi:hypothetical protein